MNASSRGSGNSTDSGERDDGWLPTLMAGPFGNTFQDRLRELITLQSGAAKAMADVFLGGSADEQAGDDAAQHSQWRAVADRMGQLWAEFLKEQQSGLNVPFADPGRWMDLAAGWMKQAPMGDPKVQERIFADSMALWESVLGQFGIGADADRIAELPRKDRRFSDPKWREQPLFAILHQSYLMMAEQMIAAAENAEGMSEERRLQLKFFTRLAAEAMSPANYALTNPLVLEKTLETGGENLVKGMEHLIADMKAGKLTHTDASAFELGGNIANTPGKVIYQTDLFQLIQYTPTTDTVLGVPLLIFPPWINRFYILDLGEKKSFIRWAVEQGLSVFVVSWKSADATMADLTWSDYVRAQIEAIDVVRERLKVPGVHTIGYCVGGTTLAATLAVLARRGEGEKVKSATFFTSQVDFAEAGDLKAFIDDTQLAAIDQMAGSGFVDGRYLAVTFNLLRSPDLFWNYVIRNYLLGEDYAAFDLLHWNGDTTNLPARWHREYLRDLYRDNRMVIPDSLTVDDTPIDLRKIKTPAYIQAGREDHIAPPVSVWKMTRHLSGPVRFMLAGSGHIAGVVNPPSSGKYQYWTLEDDGTLPDTLDGFTAMARETAGSWWPDWIEWIRGHDPKMVKASGKRVPGKRGDHVIEDAPGTYVKSP